LLIYGIKKLKLAGLE